MDARKHKPGAYDTEMRTAMLDFQQKHAVMDQADIKRATLEALARPPLENDFVALERVLTERAMQAAGFIEDGSVGDSVSDPTYPTYLGARRRAPPRSRSGDGGARRDAERARHRDARGRGRVLPPPPARRLSLAEGRGPAAAAARVLRRRRWTCRSRSIAATSGTTSRSTPTGVRQPQPRERFPQLTLLREVARRARAARALADDGRWLARRAGERRAGVLPLQGLRRRPARLAPHRHRAGLDPAALVAARLRW